NEVNAGRARALVNEHQRVVDELRALGTVTLDRAGNAWTIQNASQLRLRQFAAELRRCPSFLPQNPLTIEATSGLRDKATALVQVVRQFLANEGIRARLTDSPIKTKRKWRWPWTAHKPTATVVVSVDGMDQMLQAWRQSVEADNIVSAHEFGHLLGLPDEYLDYSGYGNLAIRNSQPNWHAFCDAAHVARRGYNSQFNDSMMSVGTVLYPSHAVTLWRALDGMTRRAPNRLPQGSWTINVL
ncbi:MAG: hypothetical protein ACYTFI_18155, partial [Planctomycetota bacterium]